MDFSNTQNSQSPAYRRVLLKLSGEAFIHKVSDKAVAQSGEQRFGIVPEVVNRLANEVLEVASMGVEMAIVIGGGNLFRGRALTPMGLEPVTSDQMGMLSTLINALAFKDALKKYGKPTRILSAITAGSFVEPFNWEKAIALLEQGNIVLFAGGTGNPFVTTDSAASLRGVQIKADIILKGTHVDGVYSEDPEKNPNAELYHHVTFDQAIHQELGVMDQAAFHQCKENKLPIRVFNIGKPGALLRALTGEQEGTLVQ